MNPDKDDNDTDDFPGSSATRLGDTPPNVSQPKVQSRGGDDDLRNDVLSAIGTTGLEPGIIDVRVRNAEVTLIGVVDRPETKVAVGNAVGGVPGVKNLNVQIDVRRGKTGQPEQSTQS